MENFDLLFKKVEPLDKEANKLKAIVACKTLKIISIVLLCLAAVLLLLFTLGTALITFGASLFLLVFGIALLAIAGLLDIFTIIYTKRYIEEFEAGRTPKLTGIYVFMVFSAIYFVDSIFRTAAISVIAYGFMIYLWYVVMTCIKNLNSIDYTIE